ncbi:MULTISPECIES: hypothetical protein [unclassified Sutcliffiella]|jgi:hypothetical protein|uniref:hypothetical protein n=1 Tax=unclassified Sutcliffiella TaxID=2837532 RepID=UPI0030CB8F5E
MITRIHKVSHREMELNEGLIINFVFMGFIFLFSIFILFLSSRHKKELHDLGERKGIFVYLCFISVNSFVGSEVFDYDPLLWISLIGIIGIIIIFYPIKVLEKSKVVLLIAIVLIIFAVIRVPTHPGSFEQYIDSKEGFECLLSFECAKLTTVIAEDDTLSTNVEILPVRESIYDWYLVFGKGYMELEGEQPFRAINIAGFWIEY